MAEADSPRGSSHHQGSNQTLQDQHENSSKVSERNVKETAEDGQQDSPPPVGFWDPRLHKTRVQVARQWSGTTLLLMTFIMAILSLYWAVLFRVPENMKSLTTLVVDFDGQSPPYNNVRPLLGPAIQQAAQTQMMKEKGVIGWTIANPADFNHDPIAVRQFVYDDHAWAAIIVNNNATALLQEAVANGNQSYDPSGACQVIYVQARDETTHGNYITPQLTQFQIEVQAMFGKQWTQQVLSNDSLDPTVYSRVPQALSPAIGFSIFNLRPFQPATATPAVSIGLIYLIILAFFSFAFYIPIYSKFIMKEEHPPMHFWELMLWRLGMVLLTYFFMSLAYSLVSLAFLIPFSNTYPHNDVTVAQNPDAYGKATFVVYWMLNWVGMVALGLASENVTMVVGQPWTSMWLIFWVITNVSTSFYSIPLSPGFFRWGYAWPLHNVVYASRTILFDTHSRIGLNFGVLLAWCAINIICFFPAATYFRYQNAKCEMKKSPRSHLQWLLDG